jgi:hypothetical protein
LKGILDSLVEEKVKSKNSTADFFVICCFAYGEQVRVQTLSPRYHGEVL